MEGTLEPGAAGLQALGIAGGLLVFIIFLAAWSAVWKGIALWKAARRDSLGWYILLFILNTAGILEIIYIFAVAPKQPELGQQTATRF